MSITADRLKDMRRAAGLTQEEVAERLNVTRGAVGHWERGKNEPSYDILIQLARLYNTSTAYLIGETDDPSPLTGGSQPQLSTEARPSGWGRLSRSEREQILRVADEVKEEVKELLVQRLLEGKDS